MVKAKLLRRSGGHGEGGNVFVGFRIEGHADFGEAGKDIVCAGVSAIAQAALFGLQDILGNGVKFRKGSGYLEVEVDPGKAEAEGPKAIFRSLQLGLLGIQESYPGTVKIEEVNLF